MKVLKFGGTSVGSVESIKNVKKIVEACDEPVIVVVSALGGITDKLIETARLAGTGDSEYLTHFKEIIHRHHNVIDGIVPEKRQQETPPCFPPSYKVPSNRFLHCERQSGLYIPVTLPFSHPYIVFLHEQNEPAKMLLFALFCRSVSLYYLLTY